MVVMALTIHSSFLPHRDPEESLAFYRDVLGFEVRLDVDQGDLRWITVGPADQPDTNVVLQPPVCDPTISEAERTVIEDLMAKGTYAALNLATDDLDQTFDSLVSRGADVVQEPKDQPYGLRDCAVRDPAGNLIRIKQN
ncbi:VOC family protein [Mariniluteicoccus endophyticus]